MANMLEASVSITGSKPLLWHAFGPETIPLEKQERTGVGRTYRRGFLIGRFLAAGLVIGSLLLLAGVLVAGATKSTGATAVSVDPAPSAQSIALADFRRAGLPNSFKVCTADLETVHKDRLDMAAVAQAGTVAVNPLRRDAAQMESDCQQAAADVQQMAVSEPLAKLARTLTYEALTGYVSAGTDDAAGFISLQAGKDDEGIAHFQSADRAYYVANARLGASLQDLGLPPQRRDAPMTPAPAPVQATPQVPAGTDAVLAPLMNATGYDALRNTAVLGISADTYVRAQGFDARTGQTVTPNLCLIYWAVARYARTTLQGEPIDVVETVLAQTLDVDYSAMTPQNAYMWTQQLMGPHST